MALALLAPERSAQEYGVVASVAPGSAAARAGVAPGDRVLAINGRRPRDIIDFRFYTADDELTLDLQRGETAYTARVSHGPNNPLGLELHGDGLEMIVECNNHCPFCFVTQNPNGLRRTLAIKDDDYRYSFLFAHFVTLTNLSDEDWTRIAEQHLSPLYISVHSTDAQMRRKLLGNRFAEDPLAQIDRLAALGITVHTQLVTCPGINDGAYMEQSIADLQARYPQVQSISVVPVGLTRIRTERTMSRGFPLRKFRPDEADVVLSQLEPLQRRNVARHGEPVIYACDEFYLLAGREVPPAAHYGDWSQLENGVGMVRQMLEDWRQLRRRLPAVLPRPRRLSVVCGTLASPVFQRIVDEMNGVGNLRVDLCVVRNRLFGEEVTCSGLLAGRDVLADLAERALGDTLVLPRLMFDHGGTRTIDDVTLDEMRAAAGRPTLLARRLTELGEELAA